MMNIQIPEKQGSENEPFIMKMAGSILPGKPSGRFTLF
jgi:hypothetical protein